MEARQVQEVEFGAILSTNPVVIEYAVRGRTVAGSNHRWRCWFICGTRKRSGNLHNSGRCWRRCGWQYDRRASHSSARSRAHDPNGLRKNTVYCSEVDSVNAFAKGQRVRVLTQGALARVYPNSCVVRASDQGIQIENLIERAL